MFSNREEINYSSVLGELKHSFRYDKAMLSVTKHSSIIFFYYPGDIPVMQKVKGIPSFISFLEPSFLRFAYSHNL